MTTEGAINVIKLARWHASAKEHEAIDTLIAMALEVEEMRLQMAKQDEQIEKLCIMTNKGTTDRVIWGMGK